MGLGYRRPLPDERPARIRWDGLRTALLGERTTAEEEAAYFAESRDRDIRRLRVLAPMALVLHVSHIAMHWVSAAERPLLAASVAHWHDMVVRVHTATLPVALAIIAVSWLAPTSRLAGWLMTMSSAAYLAHGAMASGVDQIHFASMDAFTGYCFGVAVIAGFSLPNGIPVYAVGAAAMTAALFHFQPDPAIRLSSLGHTGTVVATGLLLNALLAAARRRDFSQRRTIARQRDELAVLNTDLERRVAEQVAEIVRRADEVNKLNAQLRSQIRARSNELQLALAELAAHRGDEERSLPAGEVVGERFEIRERIGTGGMGVVYAGTDRVTGSPVAIKVIRTGPAVEVDSMRRFLGEAGTVAAIEHPAIVRMVHVDVSGKGLLYQAQELVAGRSLDDVLLEGPWPQADVARFGAVLLDALACAHERGVIHRDVKPSNVMLVRETPGLKLLDFGLAKLYDEVSRDSQSQTATGLIVGTPAYMAPEQVLAKELTDRADVYSAGVLMFQLLTGRLAFETDGASRVMLSHVSVDAPDVRSLKDDVDPRLADAIASALRKDPATRPSASAMSRTLRRIADAHGAPPLEEIVESLGGVQAGASESGDSGRHRSIARRLAFAVALAALAR